MVVEDPGPTPLPFVDPERDLDAVREVAATRRVLLADITGTDVLEEDRATGRRVFRFVRGPIFAHVVLADEVNRTPPKTQAALLQSMQEGRVSAGGQTYALP